MNYKIISQALRAKRRSMANQVGGIITIAAAVSDIDKQNLHVLRCSRFAADAEALYAVSGRMQDKDQAEHWRALATMGVA